MPPLRIEVKTFSLQNGCFTTEFKVKLHYVDIGNQASQAHNLPQALITQTKPQQRIQEHSC